MSIAVTGAVLAAVLGPEEARKLTEEAKASAEGLRRKMVALWEGEAHLALGYESWQAYCEAEFGINPKSAQHILDHARVERAVISSDHRQPAPSQQIAITSLAQLLPATNQNSANRGRDGSDAQVAEAWSVVVEARERSDEPKAPITANFAKKVLVESGFLHADRATRHKPGWMEMLGDVADTLTLAEKKLARVEKAINREPNDALKAKARQYGEWAEGLAERLWVIAGEAPASDDV